MTKTLQEYNVGLGKVKQKRPGGQEVGQEVDFLLVKYSFGKYGLHAQRLQNGETKSQSMIDLETDHFISFEG